MSVFNEKGERALQKAYERPDVQEAMKKIVENDLPYISLILSAALEEMEKENCDADNSESNTGTDSV